MTGAARGGIGQQLDKLLGDPGPLIESRYDVRTRSAGDALRIRGMNRFQPHGMGPVSLCRQNKEVGESNILLSAPRSLVGGCAYAAGRSLTHDFRQSAQP